MADNENFSETSSNWFLLFGTLAFLGIALLPAVIKIIQLISANY